MSIRNRLLLTTLVAVAVTVLGYKIFDLGGNRRLPLDESEFYAAVADGRVEDAEITADSVGYEIRGKLKPDIDASDGGATHEFTTYVAKDGDLSRQLREQGVVVKAHKPSSGAVGVTLATWIPLLLFLGIFVFFMRRMQGGGSQLSAMQRSRAKLSAHNVKVSFKDVAGVEEAKQELQEIIEFLREPEKFQKLGAKIPTGVLLTGSPGTGKTLLARAVAGEADVPFFSISGSDFVEMFVGIGASRVRDLFEQGRKQAPCIIFVDEIDAVGRHRGAGVGGGHDEREQTLNQLLVELDGFEANTGVIVLAATNRPDVLDPALLRPGRFDRVVIVDRPDVRGREQILRVHTRKVPLHADVEPVLIARGTPGFSGAELANLVNEAALYAAGLGRDAVTRDDFEQAKDKVLMGSARRSLVISDDERCAMAYHQAGHALLAHLLPEADPLHKVTIVPRGRDLGTTQQLPLEDRHSATRSYLQAAICGLMGGRVAERLHLNRLSTGAGDDLERCTKLARRMVTEWGMAESLGPLAYGKPKEQLFLGREIAQRRDYSEVTATEIDREVRKIVVHGQDEARRMLEQHAETLIAIAEALLVRETLGAEEIATLVRGETLPAIPALGADGREAVDAERPGHAADDLTENIMGGGLPLLPEPGPRPA